MLRIAVQSKGRLFEDTMALFTEADIKLSTSKRTLLTQSSNFPVEVLFLRDDDIPQCVANGVADLGIVGENEFVERAEEAEIVHRLGFSKCRLSLAIHKETEYNGLEWFNQKKIATSYPNILKNFLSLFYHYKTARLYDYTLFGAPRADGGKPEPYFSRALARHIDRRRKKAGDGFRRVPAEYCTGCSGQQ